MKDLFVNYNQALELKELGFDEPCFIKVWWLNSVHYQTKEPFKPHITMNGHDIKFEYPIPEKHPFSEFGVLELQVPTFSQAFRFFREKYDITQTVARDGSLAKEGKWAYTIVSDYIFFNDGYLSYEEAESACLDKLIEIAKTK